MRPFSCPRYLALFFPWPFLLYDSVRTTRGTISDELVSCRDTRFSLAAAQDVLFSSSPVKLHRLVNWSDGAASRSDVAGMQVSMRALIFHIVYLFVVVDVF